MRALALLFVLAATASEPLELSPRTGTAPFTAKVLGPPSLLERAQHCSFGFAGFGFFVDWGDGSTPPMDREHPDCTKMLEHTYTVGGTFEVKAQLVHPGPTDAPVTDWAGSDSVTVNAGKQSGPKVKLLETFSEADFHYGTGFPPVRFHAEVSSASDLDAELLTPDGHVLFRAQKTIRASGDDTVAFADYGNGPSAAAFDKGVLHAYVRLTLIADKKSAIAKSRPIVIHASATFRSLEVKTATLRVEASASIHHPECYSYIVDWGDGTAPSRSEGFVRKKSCALASDAVRVSHQYAKSGHYVIRWYDNDGDPFREAAEEPGYLEKTVTVGK